MTRGQIGDESLQHGDGLMALLFVIEHCATKLKTVQDIKRLCRAYVSPFKRQLDFKRREPL